MVFPATFLSLDDALVRRGDQLAVFLVYDRPEREAERPGLKRLHFARRCQSDEGLETTTRVFRSIGGYVKLFAGERPFIEALGSGRLDNLGRSLRIAYNGIGWGVGSDGFMPGRKALVPLLADSYRMASTNADAYPCAFTLHKFHSFRVLSTLGLAVPRTWQWRQDVGWVGCRPPQDLRVIAKSTYEAWSVGVTDSSVFDVDVDTDDRVAAISEEIGQPVIVQEFVSGTEVCVPVISRRTPFAATPVEAVLRRAPGDPSAFMTIDDTTSDDGYSHRPFDGPDCVIADLRETAVRVFRLLELSGVSRIDFRVDTAGQPWLIDVAVEPAIGVRGSAFLAFAELGVEHSTYVRLLVAASLEDAGALSAPGR